MKSHYTYLIRNKVTGQCYIGVRSCNGLPEDDVDYMSSSESLKEAVKENPPEFQKRVLRRFGSRHDALAHEIELHERYNVGDSKKFFNKVKQTSKGFNNQGRRYKLRKPFTKEHKEKISNYAKSRVGPAAPMYGKKHSESTKEKIRNARKKQTFSEETKKKLSDRQIGAKNCMYGKHHSEETKRKISEAKSGPNHHMYGKNLAEDVKQKIGRANIGKKWFNNGKQAIRVFPGEEPNGFRPGKKLVI